MDFCLISTEPLPVGGLMWNKSHVIASSPVLSISILTGNRTTPWIYIHLGSLKCCKVADHQTIMGGGTRSILKLVELNFLHVLEQEA
jgi:hypothetical protein